MLLNFRFPAQAEKTATKAEMQVLRSQVKALTEEKRPKKENTIEESLSFNQLKVVAASQKSYILTYDAETEKWPLIVDSSEQCGRYLRFSAKNNHRFS